MAKIEGNWDLFLDSSSYGFDQIALKALADNPAYLHSAVVGENILTGDKDSSVIVNIPKIIVPGIYYASSPNKIIMGFKDPSPGDRESKQAHSTSASSQLASAPSTDQVELKLGRLRRLVLEEMGFIPHDLVKAQRNLLSSDSAALKRRAVPFTNLARRKTAKENIKDNIRSKKGAKVFDIHEHWGTPVYEKRQENATCAVIIALGVPPQIGNVKNGFLAKAFYLGLKAYLEENYNHVEILFIHQAEVPEPVSEGFLFTPRQSSLVSVQKPSYQAALHKLDHYYPKDEWDAFAFQLSEDRSVDDKETQAALPSLIALTNRCVAAGVIRIGENSRVNQAFSSGSVFKSFPNDMSNFLSEEVVREKYEAARAVKTALKIAGFTEIKK